MSRVNEALPEPERRQVNNDFFNIVGATYPKGWKKIPQFGSKKYKSFIKEKGWKWITESES